MYTCLPRPPDDEYMMVCIYVYIYIHTYICIHVFLGLLTYEGTGQNMLFICLSLFIDLLICLSLATFICKKCVYVCRPPDVRGHRPKYVAYLGTCQK